MNYKNTVFHKLWETNLYIIMASRPKKHNKILSHLKTDVQNDRLKMVAKSNFEDLVFENVNQNKRTGTGMSKGSNK